MLGADLLLSALLEGRCIRTRAPLLASERHVSRRAFPALYAGKRDGSEEAYLREISRTIPLVLARPDVTAVARESIRDFMTFVIESGEMYREEFVHRYVFEFWDTLWEEPHDAISLSERYFKGNPANLADTQFSKQFLPRVRTAEAEVDVVALGGAANRTLFLIEVKLGELDDRAVGQILRYYKLGRDACDLHYHGCDVREVVPVLIVREVPLAIWDAVPQYFREVLRMYLYRVREGRVVLSDARRILQSQVRDRLYA
jgi:hypothetical protein